MSARLVTVNSTSGANGSFPLGDSPARIGRAVYSEVTLDDPEVSKEHAVVEPREGAYWVVDQQSANGVKVNGERVRERRLVTGDLLTLGGTVLRYESSDKDASGSVTILPSSPLDRTHVLVSTPMGVGTLATGQELAAVRRQYERVRTAFAAVARLIDTTDIGVLCQRILDSSCELVPAQAGAVLLFDHEAKLVPWASRNERGPCDVLLSRTIVDEVVRTRAAILATDALTDNRFKGSQSIIVSGLRSLMCVPLVHTDKIFGILHVGHTRETGAFTEDDLELMVGIGAGAGVALSNAFMAHRLAEEVRTRESLGRFLSPVIVEQALARRIDLKRGGDEREVTVMFADIRGFTSLSERQPATHVVRMLNEFFDAMVDVVFRHGGVLDKFIGDAVMAVWGTPTTQPDDAERAMRAAHEMQRALGMLNERRVLRKEEPIAMGIGVASGLCVAGAMGARRRLDYTVVGDAVNLASRLSGMAEAGEILLDDVTFTRAGAPKDAVPLPPSAVKGKARPVVAYRAAR